MPGFLCRKQGGPFPGTSLWTPPWLAGSEWAPRWQPMPCWRGRARRRLSWSPRASRTCCTSAPRPGPSCSTWSVVRLLSACGCVRRVEQFKARQHFTFPMWNSTWSFIVLFRMQVLKLKLLHFAISGRLSWSLSSVCALTLIFSHWSAKPALFNSNKSQCTSQCPAVKILMNEHLANKKNTFLTPINRVLAGGGSSRGALRGGHRSGRASRPPPRWLSAAQERCQTHRHRWETPAFTGWYVPSDACLIMFSQKHDWLFPESVPIVLKLWSLMNFPSPWHPLAKCQGSTVPVLQLHDISHQLLNWYLNKNKKNLFASANVSQGAPGILWRCGRSWIWRKWSKTWEEFCPVASPVWPSSSCTRTRKLL